MQDRILKIFHVFSARQGKRNREMRKRKITENQK